MEITKEQIKRLSKAVTEIEKDVLIDDDVSGGYLPEPYKTSIVEIYNVINECEGSMQPSTESKLNMPVVMKSVCGRHSYEVKHKDLIPIKVCKKCGHVK